MDIDYEKLMAGKSEQSLMDYITKTERYTEDAIVAAMKELIKRGKQFSEVETNEIKLKLEEKKTLKINEDKKFKGNSWTKNVVTDPDAPAYYSHRAIWGFSTFFTVIFGAVLLSSNLKGNARWIVLAFGILYTSAAIVLLSFLPQSTPLTLGINAGGSLIMTQFFWNKYIGTDTKYRTKPIWKPLIISILIIIPFILAIIYAPQE